MSVLKVVVGSVLVFRFARWQGFGVGCFLVCPAAGPSVRAILAQPSRSFDMMFLCLGVLLCMENCACGADAVQPQVFIRSGKCFSDFVSNSWYTSEFGFSEGGTSSVFSQPLPVVVRVVWTPPFDRTSPPALCLEIDIEKRQKSVFRFTTYGTALT